MVKRGLFHSSFTEVAFLPQNQRGVMVPEGTLQKAEGLSLATGNSS